MELRIRDLSTACPSGGQALSRVSLTIPCGMYGLLGPHGAGKSTLLRIIATLQEPDEGTITLGDIDVLCRKDEARKTLGYLPREFGLFPRGSAENLLDYFALMKGIIERRARREVVEALLQVTNRRRFGAAVALLGDPKLMIVDQPTIGLDPIERMRFLNSLSALGENRIVLLSTNRVDDVSECCTRLAIVDRGDILLEAEPLRAIDELEGRVWRRVISRDELPALEREHAVISTRLLAGRIVARVYGDAPPGPGCEAAEPGLEDVYFGTVAGYIGRRREPPAPAFDARPGRRNLELVPSRGVRRVPWRSR